MESFNEKLSSWLDVQNFMLSEKNKQEEIFEMIESAECIENITDDEKELIKRTFQSMLKLSFILNNHPSETEKLIEYLQ
jgi:hypothetical protein